MSDHSTVHETFVVERTYDAAPSRVFAAWASREAKAKWFVGTMEGEDDYALDFRIDGVEHARGGPDGGPVYSYEARYYDIVPQERIAYTYVMDADKVRISVSLAVVEFEAAGSGTRLRITDHGVYLDGGDNAAQRKHGVEAQMDKLGTTIS
jgi:uncharacterized protein YndB with AHSA1/START domain